MNIRNETNPSQQGMPVPRLPQNKHEVRCGICARSVEVDEEIYRFLSDAISSGLDNPFRCEICQAEYDDLVYEG